MIKQVIVLRTDLNMRKGKMAAQASHASMKVFFDLCVPYPAGGGIYVPLTTEMRQWVHGIFTKIVVGCDSEEELEGLFQQAKENNIPCAMVVDAGRTEFKEPTKTAIAIGPDHATKIDRITGHLKLL